MVRYTEAALLLLNGAIAVSQATNTTGVKCPSTAKFTPISASKWFDSMNPGWNLGNTLDAVETEGSWNNAPVVGSTFDDVKKAGFNGVRLPVTWAYHFTSQSPDWTVDPAWLQRVADVVDLITSRDLYAIVNVHHDSWTWADLTAASTNVSAVEERLGRLWYQIGMTLACKSEKVAFEPINEIPGTTAEHFATVNRLNGIFLKEINEAGGYNGMRVVTLVGAGEDGVKTVKGFERPDVNKFKNPWGIQYHYYSPYDFVFNAWGKTTWGSPTDKASLEADMAAVRANFSDVPLIIGEWAVSPIATEPAARWRYFDFFVRTAAKYNTSTVLWDNGADFLNRGAHVWRDEVAVDIYRNAVIGIPNALPDSTTDGSPPQLSSAYIYHKANASVVDVTLPFLFNNNTLSSISLGTQPLLQGNHYTVTTSDITFTASFLTTVIAPSSPLGTLATLTLSFSHGATLQIPIIHYTAPTTPTSSLPLPAPSTDILIPITWAGQTRPAAVKAVKADGGYLVDDWTQYLPVLQQGRMTYASQWDWDQGNVVIKKGVVEAVREAGQSTVFTVEFWPREEGNRLDVRVEV